jgi:hypothetical protein
MGIKEVLLKQFDNCYDKNEWFVAVRNAIEGVTAEQAAWKPDRVQHSIWELLSHLIHDNNAFLQRSQGLEYKSHVASNDETFNPVTGSWESDLERFGTIMANLRELIQNANESKFNEPTPPRNELWQNELASLNAHNAYHGGQIVLLRKLQESWDPGKGVS